MFSELFNKPLRQLARSSFLVVLQPVDCKLVIQIKSEFLKLPEELLYGPYQSTW